MQKRGVFSYFLSNFVANKHLYSMLYIKQMEPCGKASHDKKLKRDGKKKVLYVNQEIVPYVPESEMSIMGGELPNKIQEKDLRFVLSCLNGETSMSVADSSMR